MGDVKFDGFGSVESFATCIKHGWASAPNDIDTDCTRSRSLEINVSDGVQRCTWNLPADCNLSSR